METQIQAGEYDCGFYAIAKVTALVHIEDPCERYFMIKKMRLHLFQSLERIHCTIP